MFYPKINSLYKREGYDYASTGIKPKIGNLLIGEYACPEFEIIKLWSVTEKIDGTNLRITWQKTEEHPQGHVSFGGRTQAAMIPARIYEYLQDTFTLQKMREAFQGSNFTVLFGEGIGAKVQGNLYGEEPRFVLFDAFCSGWWLDRSSLYQISSDFDVIIAPAYFSLRPNNAFEVEEIVDLVKEKLDSKLALYTLGKDMVAEGVVCRSLYPMLFRNKEPVMFKLKVKDF